MNSEPADQMKVYTLDDLSRSNGESGNATLIAVHGKVYDISGSSKWISGRHMNRHRAGRDLTVELKSAPHGREVLERFDLVGAYEGAPKKRPVGLRGKVDAILERHPFFRRHPHPAVVHIPVGLAVAMPIFEVIGLTVGSEYTEWAAYCCLILLLFSLPVAMATGYFTWWVNYDCAKFGTVNWKRCLAWVAAALALVAVVLRAFISDPLALRDPTVFVYFVIVLIVAAVLGVVGFLGGKLIFPYE